MARFLGGKDKAAILFSSVRYLQNSGPEVEQNLTGRNIKGLSSTTNLSKILRLFTRSLETPAFVFKRVKSVTKMR